nr:carboxypeptidase regulatory-like domain-containing protein [Bacteroidales bacterium]
MKRFFKSLSLSILVALLSVVSGFAQVTTSSMNGIVTDEAGEPLMGATVTAVHVPTGSQYYALANEKGQYNITGMRTGGPYEVEISFLGMTPVKYTEVVLNLGEPYVISAKLRSSNELEAVVLVASTTKFAADKTGAATNISQSQMVNLPSVNRSIEDVAKLSPYANGMSFAGGDGRSSNFTVDGANFNNNFGLSDGLPGGGSPISIDAIQEVQVVIAPYDVRQTNFIGGGINAVTKSGTNTLKASAYTYYYNNKMRGTKANGVELNRLDEDQRKVFGATIGGPIIKNKLFFFLNGEYSEEPSVLNLWRASTDGVADPTNYISRTTTTDLDTVSKFLKDNYGYNTGSYTNWPGTLTNKKILARVDWNINDNHKLAVRYMTTQNFKWMPTNGKSSNASSRASADRLSQYSMTYLNSCFSLQNNVSSVSVDLNSRLSDKLHNQLLATYTNIADIRGTNSSEFPFIDILDGTATTTGKIMPYISAGYELFTYNNGVRNKIVSIKDDLTYDLGRHRILAGISYEHQFANNSYMRNGTGYYRYLSLEDFLNAAAPETVALTYGYNGETNPAAQVTFNQLGAYIQDEIDVTPNFKVNAGVRFDTLLFDESDIMTNNALLALDYGGKHLDTGKWPETRVMVSPRIGFSWDVFGDKSLKIRGGSGFFTGRLPLVFFTNMPTNSGMVQNVSAITTKWEGKVSTPDPLLANFAGGIITDKQKLLEKLNSLDSETFPITFTPEDGALQKTLQGVDENFKMPMVWKTSIAADYQFKTSFPLSVTAEFTYNKAIHATRMINWNIKDSESWDRMPGADDRLIYPSDYKYQSRDAFILTNTDQGYGYTANITVNATPIPSLQLMAAYTRTESKELTGMPGSDAGSAFTSLYTVNGPQFATLQRSQYVVPDRVIASATWTRRSKRGFDTHVSAMYEGCSSGGYSFIYANDVNLDGSAYDLIYIPNTPDEIQFASAKDQIDFWKFVNQDKYLSSHKGQYAEAYSARAPWVHTVDLRVAQDIAVKIGNSMNKLQLSVDILNFGNLLNDKWGLPSVLDCNSGKLLECTNAEQIS